MSNVKSCVELIGDFSPSKLHRKLLALGSAGGISQEVMLVQFAQTYLLRLRFTRQILKNLS
jgi:hypothetical protein